MCSFLGYGTLSCGNLQSKEALRRFVLLAKGNLQTDPILFIFGANRGNVEVVLKLILQVFAAETLEEKSKYFGEVNPLIHALYLFDAAMFVMKANELHFCAVFTIFLEQVVVNLFLLLPRPNRQFVNQEWAFRIKNCVSQSDKKRLQLYDAVWNFLSLRIKTLDSSAFKLETIMKILDELLFFLFVLLAYYPCTHEMTAFSAREHISMGTILEATRNIFATFDKCVGFVFHLARMVMTTLSFSSMKISLIVGSVMIFLGIRIGHISPFPSHAESWKQIIPMITQKVQSEEAFQPLRAVILSLLRVAQFIATHPDDQNVFSIMIKTQNVFLIGNDSVCCFHRRLLGYTVLAENIVNQTMVLPNRSNAVVSLSEINFPTPVPSSPVNELEEILDLGFLDKCDSVESTVSPQQQNWVSHDTLDSPTVSSFGEPLFSSSSFVPNIGSRTSNPFASTVDRPKGHVFNFNERKECAECLKKESYFKEFSSCPRCSKSFYCSKTCQGRNWLLHRSQCSN